MELQGQQAPLTAGNFLDLVQRGAYANTVFHRVVREPSPFVVQGGDPRSSDPKCPRSVRHRQFHRSATGSPRFIPLEVKLQGETEPRYGNPVLGAGLASAWLCRISAVPWRWPARRIPIQLARSFISPSMTCPNSMAAMPSLAG